MEHSNLVLFYFSPGRLKFTPPNLGQFQCDLCHPLIFKMRNGFIGFILLWVKQRFREGNAEGGKVLEKCHWCFPQFPLSGKSWGSRITHGEVRTFLFALGGQPCWSVLFFSFQCQPAEVRPCLICPCLVLVSEIHYGKHTGLEDVSALLCSHCALLMFGTGCGGGEVTWQALLN